MCVRPCVRQAARGPEERLKDSVCVNEIRHVSVSGITPGQMFKCTESVENMNKYLQRHCQFLRLMKILTPWFRIQTEVPLRSVMVLFVTNNLCLFCSCFLSRKSFSTDFNISVQDGIYALGEAHNYALHPVSQMFPNVVFETVLMFV